MSISEEFPNGIKGYEHLVLTDIVHFPMGRVCCKYCKYCIYDRNNTSNQCAVTRETLYVIEKGVGIGCPLERMEDDSI